MGCVIAAICVHVEAIAPSLFVRHCHRGPFANAASGGIEALPGFPVRQEIWSLGKGSYVVEADSAARMGFVGSSHDGATLLNPCASCRIGSSSKLQPLLSRCGCSWNSLF
jgi:hypothetical protein